MSTTNSTGLTGLGLGTLCELLELLDQKLAGINFAIQQSRDPQSDGLCDRGEYFIGVGFVAIQQYLVETLLCTGLDKIDAYKMGPIHACGVSYANLMNSCANWWKHESEWYDKQAIPKIGEKSFAHVTGISDSAAYQLTSILFSICASDKFCLSSVVPYLEEWRSAIHQARKNTTL